jgi:AraC-like DNA-binding protein
MNDSDESAPSLPRVRFDTNAFPATERFALWHASIAYLTDAHLAPGVTPDQFSFRSEFVPLGQTHLGCTWQRGIGVYRTNGATADAPKFFFLQTYLKGGFSGYHGSQAMTVATGDIVLLDSIQPMHIWVHGDEELLSLAIPNEMLLAVLDGRFAPVHHIVPAADPAAVLLRQALVSAWQQLPGMSPAGAGSVEAMLVGALAGLLRTETTRPGRQDRPPAVEPASLAVVRAHIDRHLHEPALGAETLCQRFRCSRASLYRLFAPLGGVAGYIRQQRLERCHADLLATRPGDSVGRIALRWGFASEHHFSRLYRTAFGMKPSEALAKGQSGAVA